MNFDLLRNAAAFLLAASLFMVGCKDNKSAEKPNPAEPTSQVDENNSASKNVAEAEIEKEGDGGEEEIPEPTSVVREAHLYSPRPFPDLRLIYGK